MEIILISGGTASGKSTFAEKLKEQIQHKNVKLISMDMFYPELPKDIDISKYDFDRPEAINNSLFITKLIELIKNGETKIPFHDFATATVTHNHTQIKYPNVLIIEGMMLHTILNNIENLINAEQLETLNMDVVEVTDFIKKLMKKSINIFVKARSDNIKDSIERLRRRTIRDAEERNRTPEETAYSWKKYVHPAHFKYVSSQEELCQNIVIEENFDFNLDKISTLISKKINKDKNKF